MRSNEVTVYRCGAVSLVVLCLVVSSLTQSHRSLSETKRRQINCRDYPFAKPCRGISAKRASPVPSSSEEDLASATNFDRFVLRGFHSARSNDLIKRSSFLNSVMGPPSISSENRRSPLTQALIGMDSNA